MKYGGIILATLGTILVLMVLFSCRRGNDAREEKAPVPHPAGTHAPAAESAPEPPASLSSYIAYLSGELAKAKEQQRIERAAALVAITDKQVKWATWAAGLSALVAAGWTIAAIIWRLPVRWGLIGLIASGGLLIGARTWGKLAAMSDTLALVVLAGGALTAVVVLIVSTNRDKLPRWLSRIFA